MGVQDDDDLDWILPNRQSFDKCDLYHDTDLFKYGGCTCTQCSPVTDSPTPVPPTSLSPITFNPTLSPTESPIPAPPEGGMEISNILEVGSTFSDGFGGCSTSAYRTIDKTTEKYACGRPGGPGGFTVTPASGKMSVVKQFRLYAHNNCGNCDVVAYILEGRVNTSSPWNEIGSGDLPWKSTGAGRNARGLSIVSTFESGDTNLVFTHVSYPTNVASYSEYRVSFTETRKPTSSLLQFSELELAGYILD